MMYSDYDDDCYRDLLVAAADYNMHAHDNAT